MIKDKEIIGLINSFNLGGAERQMSYLLEHDIVSKVYLLENSLGCEISSNKKSKVRNKEISKFIKSTYLKYLYMPFYAFNLSKKIKKNTLIVSFLDRANIVNVFSKFFKKHKAIVCIRNNSSIKTVNYSGIKKLLFFVMRIVYRYSDIIVTNSKKNAYLVKKTNKLKNKVLTIYNSIEIDYIRNKSEESLTDEEKKIFDNYPVLINVARMVDQKGQWHLLRIFKKVREDLPEAKLFIVGNGKLKKYLLNLSSDLNLRVFDNSAKKIINENFDVYFLDKQNNPFKYLSRSSILVFPSIFEGLPNVLLEALACKVPIISSDCCSGPREILAPDTDFNLETEVPEYSTYGVLMPTPDGKKRIAGEDLSIIENIWRQTIVSLYNDKLKREEYIEKSTERIKNFDMDTINTEWKKLLDGID